MKKLLAKSQGKGQLWLEEHTEHVVWASEKFARVYGMDVELARKGAILHDLGKGHPAFQAMLIENPRNERKKWLDQLAAAEYVAVELENRDGEEPLLHRHEISSLGFLSLFPESEWATLVEMVIGHHKSVINDKSKRGLVDLINQFGRTETIEDHLLYWEAWAPAAIEVAAYFGIASQNITLGDAEQNLKYVSDYVKNLSDGWSPWRGLLMSADHFGSGFQEETQLKANDLFQVPDLNTFQERKDGPRAHLYPLSRISVTDSRPHTLVTAPTGAGKTDFLVRRCRSRIFYTLPFQASINAMYRRFRQDLPQGSDIRRLHSASKVALEELEEKRHRVGASDPIEDIDLQQHPGASIKVMTPHQLAGLVFCTPGHEAIALDIRGQDVILDEVHTFSAESQQMVLRIIQALTYHGCRVHVGTATLPGVLAERIRELLGTEKSVYTVTLPPEELDSFNRHIVHTSWKGAPIDEDAAMSIVAEAISNNEKVLLVANQVKKAQNWYRYLRIQHPGVPTVLIHSRYRRKDRAELERQIVALQHQDRSGPCIAVSTQVVEVSLDISYDLMLTEAAPLDALIQRFGRVNRRRSEETIGRFRPVYVLQPATKAKDVLPYELPTVLASFGVLRDGAVLAERQVQQLMNQVFPDLPVSLDKQAYKFSEEGHYRISKLTHQPRQTVIDVLKIEGATCITAGDQAAYQRANFREKPGFEIPVPASFGQWNRVQIEESGSYPFVITDGRYSYDDGENLGLISENQMNTSNQII